MDTPAATPPPNNVPRAVPPPTSPALASPADRASWAGEDAATVVEYALLMLGLAMACFGALSTLGISITKFYNRLISQL